MSDFLEDGYTEKGFIAAEEGIHGPMEFEYRPMVPAVQGRLLEKKDAEGFVDAVAKVLIRDGNLKSWSLVNGKGEGVPLTETNLKRVKPRLFDKLWQVVGGVRTSDGNPKIVDLEADSKN